MSRFPVLDDHAYVSYLQPLSFLGANQTTHLAEIRFPVQTAPIVSVVKILSPSLLTVCNEAISWLFLRAAGFPAPKNAALLALTEKKAKAILGSKMIHKELVDHGHVVAWASQKLDFSSIRALFSGTKADSKWLKLLATVQGAQIAAFDEVFLNRDRNTGNVLYTGKDLCVPIDHEHIFDYQDWIASDLSVSDRSESDTLILLKNAVKRGQFQGGAYEDVLGRMVHFSHTHQNALDACRLQILHLLEDTFPNQHEVMGERVLSFVAERTSQGWMESKLGLV